MLMAPEGYSLVALDFSSQELKLQAHACQCPAFLACYTGPKEQRKDVHAATGFYINRSVEDSLTQDENEFITLYKDGNEKAVAFRSKGKTINFASAYGAKTRKLSWELCCSESDAALFLEAKNQAFPCLSPHVERWNDLCMERGYSTTFLGARRHLHQKIAIARSQGEIDSIRRLMWSFNIQSSGSEQIKLAMGRMVTDGIINMETCWCSTIIHDEAIVTVRNDVLEEKIKALHACVTAKYADMEIEAESKPEVGKFLGKLTEFKLTGE